jgi:hypothetical protein
MALSIGIPLACFIPRPVTTNLSLPLFVDSLPAGHAAAFAMAFARWLADQRGSGLLRREGSIAAYQDMWEAISAWCLTQSPVVALASLGFADLQAFQADRFGRKTSDLSLTPRYALRLMRLIDRVLRHHAAKFDSTQTPEGAAT